jgi:hypothetical protein
MIITFGDKKMSLGQNTKCDLSAGLAKLDLEKLTDQTEIHFYNLLKKIGSKVIAVKNDSLTKDARIDNVLSMASSGTTEIKRWVEQLAETTELLHTLYHSDDREIEIVREEETSQK